MGQASLTIGLVALLISFSVFFIPTSIPQVISMLYDYVFFYVPPVLAFLGLIIGAFSVAYKYRNGLDSYGIAGIAVNLAALLIAVLWLVQLIYIG